eukprot:30861-Pelagococcus_subviridis.AAC.12
MTPTPSQSRRAVKLRLCDDAIGRGNPRVSNATRDARTGSYGEQSHLRLQKQRHLEVLHALPSHRAHLDALHVAAVRLQRDPHRVKLVADARRVRAVAVAFRYRDDELTIRRENVRRRLPRLRHHAVVRGAHEHGDVRHARTAPPHRAERRVARGVEERELAAAAALHDERAEMLTVVPYERFECRGGVQRRQKRS